MTHERRTHKFISRGAQFSIAVEVVLHALLLVSLLALLLFAPPFATMFSEYGLEDHQAVAKELIHLNIGKWPLFVGLSIFTGIVSVLFSHHLVGPMYKLRRVLQELSDRNLALQIKLRRWDYFREIEGDLNRHMDHLREDLQAVKSSAESALSLCERHDVPTEIRDELNEIRRVLDSYRGI